MADIKNLLFAWFYAPVLVFSYVLAFRDDLFFLVIVNLFFAFAIGMFIQHWVEQERSFA